MTVSDVITSLIGEWSATTHPELYKDAFSFVADLIPASSSLWHNNNLPNERDLQVTDNISYKIIRVTKAVFGATDTVCREVTWEEYIQSTDNLSIYSIASSNLYPIWARNSEGEILVSPSGGTSKIFYFQYPVDDFFNAEVDSITETLKGFPNEAIYLACIKAAINIMQYKISIAAQEEEDAELLQLLQSQLGTLQQQFQSEAGRLNLINTKRITELKGKS